MLNFDNAWIKFDPLGTGFLKISSFRKFLYKVGHPFGIGSLGLNEFLVWTKVTEIVTCKKLTDIYYHNVLYELSKNAILTDIVNFEIGNVTNSSKIQKTKAAFFSIMKGEAAEMKELPLYKKSNKTKRKKFKCLPV